MRYTSSVIIHKKDDIEILKAKLLNDFLDKCFVQNKMPPKKPNITFNLSVSISWEEKKK